MKKLFLKYLTKLVFNRETKLITKILIEFIEEFKENGAICEFSMYGSTTTRWKLNDQYNLKEIKISGVSPIHALEIVSRINDEECPTMYHHVRIGFKRFCTNFPKKVNSDSINNLIAEYKHTEHVKSLRNTKFCNGNGELL